MQALKFHNRGAAVIVYSMTVFDLKKGQSATVLNVFVSGGAAERLASLGVKRGARITLLGFSLFKSAALIAAGPARLGIRRALAQKIGVRP